MHSQQNGSDPSPNRVPDPDFTFTIARKGETAQGATEYFGTEEPRLENWNFTYFADLFARDARAPSLVLVASKAYRKVVLDEPGEYEAVLTYNNGSTTTATWLVRDLASERRAKNVVFVLCDGLTTPMITAARLIAHRTVSGKYQTRMQMDKFPVLGHQVSRSLGSPSP